MLVEEELAGFQIRSLMIEKFYVHAENYFSGISTKFVVLDR